MTLIRFSLQCAKKQQSFASRYVVDTLHTYGRNEHYTQCLHNVSVFYSSQQTSNCNQTPCLSICEVLHIRITRTTVTLSRTFILNCRLLIGTRKSDRVSVLHKFLRTIIWIAYYCHVCTVGCWKDIGIYKSQRIYEASTRIQMEK